MSVNLRCALLCLSLSLASGKDANGVMMLYRPRDISLICSESKDLRFDLSYGMGMSDTITLVFRTLNEVNYACFVEIVTQKGMNLLWVIKYPTSVTRNCLYNPNAFTVTTKDYCTTICSTITEVNDQAYYETTMFFSLHLHERGRLRFESNSSLNTNMNAHMYQVTATAARRIQYEENCAAKNETPCEMDGWKFCFTSGVYCDGIKNCGTTDWKSKRLPEHEVAVEKNNVDGIHYDWDETEVHTSLYPNDDSAKRQHCLQIPGQKQTAAEESANFIDDNLELLDLANQDGDNTEMEKSTSVSRDKVVVGRRIVDINKFFAKLKEISSHGALSCGLSSVEIIGEKLSGLHSKLTLNCKLCGAKFYIKSDEGSEMDINILAVAGTVIIGCGHSQLQELSAALDLPLISQKKYQACHDTISSLWDKISVDSMSKAAQEEKDFAIQEGRVDANGIPIIDVVVDGCWSKRSYKKNYSALSGAAGIIGKKTGKILYLGIKNKYCCICAQAEKKQQDPKNHQCFLNYSGPSTGMESTIILEGFKSSIDMHGLIYGRMVSDGDSSTYAKICQTRPYPHVSVEKIECRNHVLRNLCSRLIMLKQDTKYLIKHRKIVSQQKVLSIRKTIIKAIKRYKTESETEKNINTEFLYYDILIAHLHAFGDHSRCKAYFCEKLGSPLESHDNEFFTSTLWQRICLIMSNVASHASSLVHDVDSNSIERYNSIVAKFVGGKRINFSMRGSYHTRCKAAAVSFNTHRVLSNLYATCVGKNPCGKIKKLEEKRIKRMNLLRKYSRKRNRLTVSKEDAHYGEKCNKPDKAPEILEKEKDTFLKNLIKNEDERNKIERQTILQSGSSEWIELRRSLLTASNFGRVIKRRPYISCSNLVKDLVYKESISHVKSIKHGTENEKIALDQLSKQESVTIRRCGLFLDEDIPFLGASPDGLIDNDTIVEIKCPISAFGLDFEEAVTQKKIPFYKKIKNGSISMNNNHNWFYQVQGQLHITKRKKCMFGLWLGETRPLKVEVIERDEDFWNNKMKDKLVQFYMNCILPELLDPRHTRNMAIRDPLYIQKSAEEKEKKRCLLKRRVKRIDNEEKKNHARPERHRLETEIMDEDKENNYSRSDNQKLKDRDAIPKNIKSQRNEIFPETKITKFGELSDDDTSSYIQKKSVEETEKKMSLLKRKVNKRRYDNKDNENQARPETHKLETKMMDEDKENTYLRSENQKLKDREAIPKKILCQRNKLYPEVEIKNIRELSDDHTTSYIQKKVQKKKKKRLLLKKNESKRRLDNKQKDNHARPERHKLETEVMDKDKENINSKSDNQKLKDQDAIPKNIKSQRNEIFPEIKIKKFGELSDDDTTYTQKSVEETEMSLLKRKVNKRRYDNKDNENQARPETHKLETKMMDDKEYTYLRSENQELKDREAIPKKMKIKNIRQLSDDDTTSYIQKKVEKKKKKRLLLKRNENKRRRDNEQKDNHARPERQKLETEIMDEDKENINLRLENQKLKDQEATQKMIPCQSNEIYPELEIKYVGEISDDEVIVAEKHTQRQLTFSEF